MSKKLENITGVISLIVLVTLLYHLLCIPGGIILPGLILGIIVIALIVVAALGIVWFTKLFWKKMPGRTAFYIITAVAFIFFHYQIYSPTLKIVVPHNYTGQVTLVLSNVSENILTLDTNGIGYLSEETFNRLWSKPSVVDECGNDITDQCVGFNRSSFYALRYSTSSESDKEIISLSFKIIPTDTVGTKQNNYRSIYYNIDTEKLK